jgi:hypothetical protein
MKITVSFDGPTPRRADPLRCVVRNSPNADKLFRAARAVVDATPGAFPLPGRLGLRVLSGSTPPRYKGYDAITAITEVLVDAGLITDERQVGWEHVTLDLTLGDSYHVTLEPE